MNKFKFQLRLIAFLMLPIALNVDAQKVQYATSSSQTGFNKDSFINNIKTLSGDDFMGRKPFTDGEEKTLAFLEQKFRAAGLEPGNGSSYFQDVPMVDIDSKASSSMLVKTPSESIRLTGREDYVIWTEKTNAAASFENTEIIFAGYGVVAPEYNWNDYANIDVRGKIVLVLVNDPGFNAGDTILFKGKAMTWYGRWPYKFAEAARQGAKGCFIIHSTEAASYPFAVVQNNWNNSRLRLDDRMKPQTYCDIVGWLSFDAALRILRNSGYDNSLLQSADRRGFRSIPLNTTISTSINVTSRYATSKNVIAKITGSEFPDETIIYTAHWDHLGIGAPDERGDSIYNGALDNASGTAALFEIARAFKSAGAPPKRSIVFLAVTAEEQGLWGSEYYARNPVFPLSKTVANLNMDVLNWFGKTKDIVVVGQGQNELEDYLQEELKLLNRILVFDPHPESGSYYRSDHFNFARVGVPSMDLKYGSEVIGQKPGFGEEMAMLYRTKNYHRPSDEFNTAWTVDGALADIELLYRVGYRLATGKVWPQWKEGSEFKALRRK